MGVKAEKFPSMASFVGADTLFGRMLLLSLLIHAIAAVSFLSHRHSMSYGATAAYLDLNMAMAPQPAALVKPAKPVVSNNSFAPAPLSAARVTPQTAFDKLQENTRKSLDRASSHPEALEEASFGLSITSGYFGSIGEGETLRDDIREYYFEMLRHINEKWWLNKDAHQGGRKSAVFYLVIARNGAIVDRMMVESSGNPSYDRAMLHTLEAANPLPPLPETYRGDYFQAPLRFNMPLNLMGALGNLPYSNSSRSRSKGSISS